MFCVYSFYSKHLLRLCLIIKFNFLKGKIMKKLLALLIAGTFATVTFAMEASAPMAQDSAKPMMSQDAKASASKKMKKHHHKAKKHAQKVASDVK